MFREKDRLKCAELYKRYYAGYRFHDSFYRETVRKQISRRCRVLDAGCGRYLKFSRELNDVADVVGIDLEPILETHNESLPFGVCGDVGHLPFSSETFDVVISRSVIEHLTNPALVFREFARVLRPGGKIVILTPNKYDYVSILATLTPHVVHRRLVGKIFQVPEDDVFPTLYRANTVSAIRKTLRAAGLVERELRTLNHYPAYLMFSPLLFRLGVVYERFTSLNAFQFLRGSILCVFEKPASAGI